MTATATAHRITPKQSALIADLLVKRDVDPAEYEKMAAAVRTLSLTKTEASNLITYLLAHPRRKAVHADGNALTEGYYLQEDTVYKVVAAKSTGNLYAKALHSTEHGTASWDYAPGAMRHLTSAHRLTEEDAAAMGTRLGVCVICTRTLTDPESVERGIGPVCGAKLDR